MIVTPINELEAINEILSSIGESPIDSLEEGNNVDVMNAKRILHSVNRDVQSKKWTFNTYESYKLVPDVITKKILWDTNILYIEAPSFLRKRNGFLYDITNNTDEFTSDIECSIVYLVPFDEIPDVFKRYVTAKASRMFSTRYMGDDGLSQALAYEEQQAYQAVMEYEHDLENNSMANNPDVQRLLQR